MRRLLPRERYTPHRLHERSLRPSHLPHHYPPRHRRRPQPAPAPPTPLPIRALTPTHFRLQQGLPTERHPAVRPSTRRAPTARVRTLQELPTSEPGSSASDIFWMSDTPPALRDGYGPYTEADLNHHRQQTTAARHSATRSSDSALTTNLCLPSSIYAANDASNDYFNQLESVVALFSDP